MRTFVTLLQLLLIYLKLTEQIDTHWTWVLAPLWVSYLVAGAFFVLGVALMALGKLEDD